MKYCLSVGLHNLFFDIAIVNNKHEIISKYRCDYDRSKDISNNIYLTYKKYFNNYQIEYIGVGVSNNIVFKDNILYSITSFNFNRYDLKQSLFKLFKKDIFVIDETHLAALSVSHKLSSSALLYLVLDNKISNSFVIEKELIDLDEDIDFGLNEELDRKCSKTALKRELLHKNLDDSFISGCFYSKNDVCKEIVKEWINTLDKYIMKITKELPVKDIVFAGYLGDYFDEYKEYLSMGKKVNYQASFNHRDETLLGVSHLIFKDNR